MRFILYNQYHEVYSILFNQYHEIYSILYDQCHQIYSILYDQFLLRLECPITTDLLRKSRYDVIVCNNLKDVLYNIAVITSGKLI